MLNMAIYFLPGMATILLISAAASFMSPKFGKFVSIFISLGSIGLTIFTAPVATVGFIEFLLFGLAIFPALSWIGYFLGNYFRKKRSA